MAERGIRRLRLIAALTFAGVTGMAGGTLPQVVADDDTPPIVTTDTSTTKECPDSPLVDDKVQTVPVDEDCPVEETQTGTETGTQTETQTGTGTGTGATPPPPPPPPPTQTVETPAPPAPPAPKPAPQQATPEQAAAPAAQPLPATEAAPKPEEEHAGKPKQHGDDSAARGKDRTRDRKAPRHKRNGGTRARTKHAESEQHPLHESPYSGLAMHWTVPDPLGLDDFPEITVAQFPVPPFLLPIYQAAGAQYDIHWEILAAINEVETGFGTNLRESSAGAIGWMQFLPSTWHRYGIDADGDGDADPWDPVDSIFAAARYLHDAGAESSLPRAIWSYNHAGWYVDQIIDRARTFAGLPDDLVAVLTRQGFKDTASVHDKLGRRSYLAPHAKLELPGQALLLTRHALRHRVLDDDGIHIYPCGREDIASGRIDPRILATLKYLRLAGLHPTVSALECGHSFLTKSGNVSEHSSGDAVDIAVLNGTPVAGHQGEGSITDEAVRRLLALQGLMHAHQIITLMTYPGEDNTLSLPDHDDHIHVGFEPMARRR